MSMICDLFAVPADTLRRLMDDPSGVHEVLESLEGTEANACLEKSWHGLHFAFTRTSWGGAPPLDFLAAGGAPVGTEDVGYGPARALEPAAVVELNAALGRFTEAEFDRNFDLVELDREEIYPQIWDEPLEDLREEYLNYLNHLTALVRRAAGRGEALLVTIR